MQLNELGLRPNHINNKQEGLMYKTGGLWLDNMLREQHRIGLLLERQIS